MTDASSLRAMSEHPVIKPAEKENHGGRWIPLESNPEVRTFNVLAVAVNLCPVERDESTLSDTVSITCNS